MTFVNRAVGLLNRYILVHLLYNDCVWGHSLLSSIAVRCACSRVRFSVPRGVSGDVPNLHRPVATDQEAVISLLGAEYE